MSTTSNIVIQEDASALFSLMKQYQPSRQQRYPPVLPSGERLEFEIHPP